jgi:monoamine oxidase
VLFRSGAGKVAEALAKELEVRYTAAVTEVRQERDEVELRWVCEEGSETVRARRAILALPFTCYREIRFDPPPPPTVRRLISGSTYGVVRKMCFIFDEDVEAPTYTVTDTPLGYCSPAQSSGGIVSFVGGRPLLPELGLEAGERKERAVRLLRKLYDIPEPAMVLERVWPHDYWTRGSYMIVAPGDMASFGEAMGTTFGGVHLAGAEGYAAAPSFMNSAVKSGLRAARGVLEALGATPDLARARGR